MRIFYIFGQRVEDMHSVLLPQGITQPCWKQKRVIEISDLEGTKQKKKRWFWLISQNNLFGLMG